MTSHHPQSERTIRKTLVGTDRHTRLLGLVVVNGPLVSALVLIYVVVFSVLLQIGISRGQAHVISTIAVAMTLLPLRWRLVNWSERLLQREWQDSQSLIRDIADTLGRTIEPATINVLLTQSLPERLRLRSAVLWMLQPPDDRVFQPIEEHADPADELLAQGASALYMAHVKDYALVMMDAEQAWAAPFLKRGITLLVPLRISKRLIGIYGFGPPVRQRDYPPHVIGVLLTLAPAIASALENARAYTKIARLNDKLCSLDQRKDEFIESIGHELRTPLTSLSLATQLIAARPEAADELAGLMHQNVVRLQSLIERILSIAAPASIEARATGTIEMRGFLADMVASFIPLAQRRRVTISVEVEHRLTAVGDAMRLRRALHEIIDNAVRYSTPGTLTIRAIAHDGLAIVSVSDPGPGIPDDEQAELFSRFFRGRQTRALASTPGAGIGLSIAQREIELLGGRVWLERTGPMGTTMCLAVPTAAMPVMTEQVVLHERVLGGPDQPSS